MVDRSRFKCSPHIKQSDANQVQCSDPSTPRTETMTRNDTRQIYEIIIIGAGCVLEHRLDEILQIRTLTVLLKSGWETPGTGEEWFQFEGFEEVCERLPGQIIVFAGRVLDEVSFMERELRGG